MAIVRGFTTWTKPEQIPSKVRKKKVATLILFNCPMSTVSWRRNSLEDGTVSQESCWIGDLHYSQVRWRISKTLSSYSVCDAMTMTMTMTTLCCVVMRLTQMLRRKGSRRSKKWYSCQLDKTRGNTPKLCSTTVYVHYVLTVNFDKTLIYGWIPTCRDSSQTCVMNPT